MRNRDENVLQTNKTSMTPDVDAELLVEQESEDDTLLMLAATVVYVLGVSMDKLDGVMASYFAKQQLQHDSELGGVLDTLSDRLQEFAVSLSKINTTHQRGDALGKILALLNGISSMLPSFFRALAESQGKSVKEAGRNIGMLGTRPTRAAMALTAFYPHIGRLPLQQILDGIGTLSNVITAYQRAQVCSEAPHLTEQMDQDSSDSDRAKMREKGRLKLRYQTPVAIMCIAMLLAEYNRLNNNN
ncbi:hypothetical protein KBC89_05535, partial [Candidatus Woesebacteria bacterium]|nr:hypothetical protein [Candidatus Woesebacteria bacterium]